MENSQEATIMDKIGSGGFINEDEIIAQFGIKKGMRIADLGCGAGYFSIPMARLLQNSGTVYAVDVLSAALESIKGYAKMHGLVNIELVRANVEVVGGTKIPDATVDLVVMANILFQCKEYGAVFTEAKRLLAPGGRIAVIDWIPNDAVLGPKFENCIPEETAKRLAIENGLKVVRKLQAGQTHYGFILEII